MAMLRFKRSIARWSRKSDPRRWDLFFNGAWMWDVWAFDRTKMLFCCLFFVRGWDWGHYFDCFWELSNADNGWWFRFPLTRHGGDFDHGEIMSGMLELWVFDLHLFDGTCVCPPPFLRRAQRVFVCVLSG